MALNLPNDTRPSAQQEFAMWNALVALQRHGLENPDLIDNRHYMAALTRAQLEWADVFGAME